MADQDSPPTGESKAIIPESIFAMAIQSTVDDTCAKLLETGMDEESIRAALTAAIKLISVTAIHSTRFPSNG